MFSAEVKMGRRGNPVKSARARRTSFHVHHDAGWQPDHPVKRPLTFVKAPLAQTQKGCKQAVEETVMLRDNSWVQSCPVLQCPLLSLVCPVVNEL